MTNQGLAKAEIAEKLSKLGKQLAALAKELATGPDSDEDRVSETRSAFSFGQSSDQPGFDARESSLRMIRLTRPSLPDPRLVRRIIRQRNLRSRFFHPDLFADPAWDMLLDLCAARAEHSRVSVTSLCIASGVPPTTALRWIAQMVEMGLLHRTEDDTDRRRAFITLSDSAADAMARYFVQLGADAMQLI